MSSKVESEGRLRFYDPTQIMRLKAHAHTPLDVALYTLATEARPRLSEIIKRASAGNCRSPVLPEPSADGR